MENRVKTIIMFALLVWGVIGGSPDPRDGHSRARERHLPPESQQALGVARTLAFGYAFFTYMEGRQPVSLQELAESGYLPVDRGDLVDPYIGGSLVENAEEGLLRITRDPQNSRWEVRVGRLLGTFAVILGSEWIPLDLMSDPVAMLEEHAITTGEGRFRVPIRAGFKALPATDRLMFVRCRYTEQYFEKVAMLSGQPLRSLAQADLYPFLGVSPGRVQNPYTGSPFTLKPANEPRPVTGGIMVEFFNDPFVNKIAGREVWLPKLSCWNSQGQPVYGPEFEFRTVMQTTGSRFKLSYPPGVRTAYIALE